VEKYSKTCGSVFVLILASYIAERAMEGREGTTLLGDVKMRRSREKERG
jgi:hypothetical protein